MDELVDFRDPVVKKIEQSLRLGASLYIASLIKGPRYAGKKSMCRRLFASMKHVDAEDESRVRKMLESEQELMIFDLHKLKNPLSLDLSGKKIIATTANDLPADFEERFAYIYTMPPLPERPDDVELFTDHFAKKAKKTFMLEEDTKISIEDLDLSENFHSLISSIFREVSIKSCTMKDIQRALYLKFSKNMKGNNFYKESLGIFEKPLLRAGLAKYGSQLKLANILGINRNTLRKKINEYDIR